MNILVLGASGLLGNAIFRVLAQSEKFSVFGTIRNPKYKEFFISTLSDNLLVVKNLEDENNLIDVLKCSRPDVVINCISLDKSQFSDYTKMISIYSVFPKRLFHICRRSGIKLIHMSSDGVFNGARGNYTENDLPNATDTYGIAKLLGEIESPGAITLRTSIIGHELNSKSGLLDWFLSQGSECSGYTRVLFSGFPAVVLANVIREVILPRHDLHGIFHLATQPITKFALLQLIANKYGKSIKIVPDDSLVIDRTLSAELFANVTGYCPPGWHQLINEMYSYKFGLKERYV